LGNNSTSDSKQPVFVSGLNSAVAITTGEVHACALLSDRTVSCWGENVDGRLGNGTTNSSSVPVPVVNITNAIAISAGYRHTCAVLLDQTAWCWGDNSDDQLGVDYVSLYSSSKPVAQTGLYNGILAIGAGRAHTCAIPNSSGGAVTCWGWNSNWQLGDSSAGPNSYSPVPVSGVTAATALAAGDQHNCALIGTGPATGTIQCWGWNQNGQLGSGSHATENLAANVFPITNAIAIAAADHTCALLNDGHIQCWGFNSSGEVGDGTTTDHYTPVSVYGISTAASVTAGSVHTCALLANAETKCWGDNNFGELGDGTLTNSPLPVTVLGL
jgi:alpha-tubulin suppressor-like RCC1 family protein